MALTPQDRVSLGALTVPCAQLAVPSSLNPTPVLGSYFITEHGLRMIEGAPRKDHNLGNGPRAGFICLGLWGFENLAPLSVGP